MRRLADGLRSSLGMRLIAADGGWWRAALGALRANGVVGLAGDRGASGTGSWVRMFGHPAFLPAGAGTHPLRFGASTVPIRTRRLPGDRILPGAEAPIERGRTGDFASNVQAINQDLATRFERHIRERPDEWVVDRRVWDAPSAGNTEPNVP